MSSSPSSPSEGEIIERDVEKATKSIEAQREISVDRQSRKRYSISRSPSPYQSSRYIRSRDGSRSPYRESRGSKRLLNDDHYDRSRDDSRRFKVRYENERSDAGGSKRPSHHDREKNDHFERHLPSRDRSTKGRPYSERNRPRSRTPSGKNRVSYRYHNRKRRGDHDGDQIGQKLDDRFVGESGLELSYQQSVSDRGHSPVAAASSTRDAKMRQHQTQHNDNRSATPDLPAAKYVLPFASRPSADCCPNRHTTSPDLEAKSGLKSVDRGSVDEATLIEERRRRREAIKAKHKGQATPLLVQSLAIDVEASPLTQEYHSQEAKTDVKSINQGLAVQAGNNLTKDTSKQERDHPFSTANESHNSPTDFVITKDSDLTNGVAASDQQVHEDEPSAADYNPTMDMQEDKLRRDQHQSKAEVAAAAYDETAQADKDILLGLTAATNVAPPIAKIDGYDMFGDNDDLDMFAEPSVLAVPKQSEKSKAIPVPQTQALDMSMLDDCDDPEGYYKVILGEMLDNRYLVQSNLGKGMFSGVVRAADQRTKGLVAIKLIRNNETMKKAGIKEIEILEKLALADPEDKKHLIRLERFFEHKGHLCMVFENLSINLREVLKKFGRDVGINIKAVREYAKQMFLGLSLMRRCNILHADLKPDNVLVNESRSMLKICDLGSASDASENEITQYLVSRFYRAPEIILGLPYDFAIDMWSIGCTLFELYTGKILFTGRSNNQMLRAIMETRGKFSHKLLRKSEFAGLHFDDLLNFRSVEKDRLTAKDVVRVLNFTKPSRDLRARIMANVKGVGEDEMKELTLFVDLLDKCLNLNPEKRCTPLEALRHPFITRAKA